VNKPSWRWLIRTKVSIRRSPRDGKPVEPGVIADTWDNQVVAWPATGPMFCGG
jgi:hypothetical protein